MSDAKTNPLRAKKMYVLAALLVCVKISLLLLVSGLGSALRGLGSSYVYIQHRCFALIRYVIVPENSNQSSRPSGSLLVFTSSSHWQTGIFPLFCLVGVYSWFWFWRYSIEMRFTQLTSA